MVSEMIVLVCTIKYLYTPILHIMNLFINSYSLFLAFATWSLHAGANLVDVSKALGHSSVQVRSDFVVIVVVVVVVVVYIG